MPHPPLCTPLCRPPEFCLREGGVQRGGGRAVGGTPHQETLGFREAFFSYRTGDNKTD